MSGKDRTVTQHGDQWANKRNDAGKASSLHPTQREATQAAKEMLKHQGGGEVTIQGRHGTWVNKDTVAPGNDPYPPKG